MEMKTTERTGTEVSAISLRKPEGSWLIDGFIRRHELTLFSGDLARATAVAVGMAVAVAQGSSFAELATGEGTVLWLDFNSNRERFIQDILTFGLTRKAIEKGRFVHSRARVNWQIEGVITR